MAHPTSPSYTDPLYHNMQVISSVSDPIVQTWSGQQKKNNGSYETYKFLILQLHASQSELGEDADGSDNQWYKKFRDENGTGYS